METNVEKDCANLGGVFQQIISDMKNGTPLWEDLISKATKLQTCLRATIQAITAYLDAFQKIADAATNTRGATKEIGTALTRICLRHRAVEAKMKTFTNTIMDCLVTPLQERLEDWKKNIINLDKEHAKEYKKARSELKKRSTDTLRLQKKARKSGKMDDFQKALLDMSEKKNFLEEAERRAVREALIEERRRYCLFVTYLKPVVDEEISMLSELSHLQDAMDQLEKHTADPSTLPPASEQVLIDLKGTDTSWTSFQSPPPSSPSSIGSRKSSMCSINSINSSSSGSSKSHHSPNHMYWNRSVSQRFHAPPMSGTYRLGGVSSQDSGFTSQDTLCMRNSTASYFQQQVSDMMEENTVSTTDSTSSLAVPTVAWPNLQDTLQFEKAATAILNDRPHTISSAYEKGHQRPALSVYTFQMPNSCHSQPCSPSGVSSCGDTTPVVSPQAVYASASVASESSTSTTTSSNTSIYARPPLPQRNSSLERPRVPGKQLGCGDAGHDGGARFRNSSVDRIPQPTYVNMYELASMAAMKAQELHFPPPPPGSVHNEASHYHSEKNENVEKESSASESSLESSSGYGSQSGMSGATPTPEFDNGHSEDICSTKSSNQYLNEVSLYSVEPRTRLSSASSTGYCTIKSGTLSRRGSVQSQKPPPPVRRTSSILNAARPSVSPSRDSTAAAAAANMENLPPPPAFLLENAATAITSSQNNSSLPTPDTRRNVANSIAAELQKRQISMSTFTDQLKSATAQRIYATPMEHHRRSITTMYSPANAGVVNSTSPLPPPPVKCGEEKSDKQIEIEKSSGISVAETVRTLTEMNHQPASPVSVRRTPSVRSTSGERRPESNLISALSARIGSNSSPRSSRKIYQDVGMGKIAVIPRASRIREFFALRAAPDPTLCRASLMDQIKRGTPLRPTGVINDRSAPKTS